MRHGMPGRPYLKNKTVTTTGVEWRQHPDQSFDRSPPKQGEREYVVRRRWHGRASPALKRADQFVLGIAQDRRELLAVAVDINGGNELVVAPNLAPRAVRHSGRDGEVHHVARWNRITRRRRQDGQADFIVWTKICLAVVDAVE